MHAACVVSSLSCRRSYASTCAATTATADDDVPGTRTVTPTWGRLLRIPARQWQVSCRTHGHVPPLRRRTMRLPRETRPCTMTILGACLTFARGVGGDSRCSLVACVTSKREHTDGTFATTTSQPFPTAHRPSVPMTQPCPASPFEWLSTQVCPWRDRVAATQPAVQMGHATVPIWTGRLAVLDQMRPCVHRGTVLAPSTLT